MTLINALTQTRTVTRLSHPGLSFGPHRGVVVLGGTIKGKHVTIASFPAFLNSRIPTINEALQIING